MAGAQPDLGWVASLVGSAIGYGLFWHCLIGSPRRIFWAGLWFASVQGAHFSWMLSDLFVGKGIYVVWLALITLQGGLFACFSYFVYWTFEHRPKCLCLLPGVWVALESLRFYFLLSGISLNFLGLPLVACNYGRQFSGFFGWGGLSWFVAGMGISGFCWFQRRSYARRIWILSVITPYLLGGAHYQWIKTHWEPSQTVKVAVVQPGSALSPLRQGAVAIWKGLLELSSLVEKPIDLLIFPEVCLPFGCDQPVFPYFASPLLPSKNQDLVSNYEWLHALAEHFQCPVLAGLERWEHRDTHYLYNSAQCVTPSGRVFVYDKRILVPGGEYIPGGRFGMAICRRFFPEYASSCLRVPGSHSGLLSIDSLPKLGVSICYEETFGNLLRPYKRQGAQLLVNLTNDGWYPHSRLPMVHFYHGVLRNHELGLPCIRSCHTGVTIAADSLGRPIKVLPCESRGQSAASAVLQAEVPLCTYPTLYALWGDIPAQLVAWTSLVIFAWFFVRKKYSQQYLCFQESDLLAKKKKG